MFLEQQYPMLEICEKYKIIKYRYIKVSKIINMVTRSSSIENRLIKTKYKL